MDLQTNVLLQSTSNLISESLYIPDHVTLKSATFHGLQPPLSHLVRCIYVKNEGSDILNYSRYLQLIMLT